MLKTKIFIVVSSTALLLVLMIQINWIRQSAKVKEEMFNEKAKMVLSKTVEALSSDKETCQQMNTCIGEKELRKTDSLFNSSMVFYDFSTDYSFEVKKQNDAQATLDLSNPENVYRKKLEEEASLNGLELSLFLPAKKQFIAREMSLMFFASVLLIIVVLLMFWRTISSLIKEKRISEHTTEFLNNMTHEFKTPLTNIALAGKMMTKDSAIKQEDKIRHYSSIILEENQKLRLQVEQVLSMTALERGEIPLIKKELDFHELIQKSLKCIEVQIENSQGNLNLALNAEKTLINGDWEHLSSTFCNLIDNAIKYSPGSPMISIETSNQLENLIIVIQDQGLGIKKQFHKKVFEKYFRVSTGDIHNVKGFGLGLAYVKKIIELHDGKIELQSGFGAGTRFTISLPNA